MYKNKKALIVDDEERARLYLASILSELYPKLDIQLVSTPAEALFLLKKQCFDVVLLDVEMPGMTGLDLAGELQQQLKTIPVIFVSAYKRAEFIQKALRLNALDYIDKPVNPLELDAAIKKAFETQSNKDLTLDNHNSRICLLTDSGEQFIGYDEIVYFQSAKRYAIVYFLDGTNRIVRYNLIQLSELLSKNCFLHVGRQYIVNVKYIKFASKANKSLTLAYGIESIVLDKVFPGVLSELIDKHSIRH